MGRYFDYYYDGAPFELFGTAHLTFLAVDLLIILWLIYGWKNPSEEAKKRGRTILAGVLLVGEGSWHIWNLYWGSWDVTQHVPLHVCSVLVWASIAMLFTKNYRIYEFSYFLGIGASIQPVLTPEAGIYGFPHYRVFQTMVVHSALVMVPIYMTVIEGMRPTWKSILRVFIGTNIYMVVVYFINLALGSNYMFVVHKPETASLMDVLGPWPWYLLSLQVIGGIVFLLLYLPFIIKDYKAKKTAMT